MTQYVDSSALLKRYVDEPDSTRATQLIDSDDSLVTGRHTIVEVRRNLARLLDATAAREARSNFSEDIREFDIVELDDGTCELAAAIAEQTGVRTLDALHLGCARQAGAAHHLLDVRRSAGGCCPRTRLPGRRRLRTRQRDPVRRPGGKRWLVCGMVSW